MLRKFIVIALLITWAGRREKRCATRPCRWLHWGVVEGLLVGVVDGTENVGHVVKDASLAIRGRVLDADRLDLADQVVRVHFLARLYLTSQHGFKPLSGLRSGAKVQG